MRHASDEYLANRGYEVVVKGAKFQFRTLHGPVARGLRAPDQKVTVTLPAVPGHDHPMVPTMEVVLK